MLKLFILTFLFGYVFSGLSSSSSSSSSSESDSDSHDGDALKSNKRLGSKLLEVLGELLEVDRIEDKNGRVLDLFQGDVVMKVEDENDVGRRRRLSPIMKNIATRWKNGIVPYVIDRALCNDNNFMTKFKDVVGRFATKTGVRLIPTPNTATNYDHVRFFVGGGCYSSLGNVWGSKRQDISIGRGCAHVGVIIHEILHALGIMHTQTRLDRDNYVTINFANIRKGMEHNFKKVNPNVFEDCLAYDYGSVMHYGPNGFSINGKPTITAKKSGVRLGQRSGFSNNDVLCVRKMYPGLQIPGRAAPVKCYGSGSPAPNPTKKPAPKPTRRPAPTKRPAPKPTTTTGCRDVRATTSCVAWKKRGYCAKTSRYYRYLFANCKKTCGFCGAPVTKPTKRPAPRPTRPPVTRPTSPTTCRDVRATNSCVAWKKRGYCAKTSRYHGYLLANCKKTCGFCVCKDVRPASQCAGWAKRGFCTNARYAAWMGTNCAKTCKKCSSAAMAPDGIIDDYDVPEYIPNNMNNVIGKEIFGLQFAVVTLVIAVTVLLIYVLNLKCKEKRVTKYDKVSIESSESESETPLKNLQ